jgi:hypothetical protein
VPKWQIQEKAQVLWEAVSMSHRMTPVASIELSLITVQIIISVGTQALTVIILTEPVMKISMVMSSINGTRPLGVVTAAVDRDR